MFDLSNRDEAHSDTYCCQRLEMRPANLWAASPHQSALHIPNAFYHHKKKGIVTEVFIVVVDKHYTLMQFCRNAFLSLLEGIYLLETCKMVATGKDSF